MGNQADTNITIASSPRAVRGGGGVTAVACNHTHTYILTCSVCILMSLCGIKAKNAECAVSRFVGIKFCNMTVNTKYYFMLIFM